MIGVRKGSYCTARPPETMSAKIERVEGHKFRAIVNGFEIVTGKVSENASPSGMSPGGVLFASVGLCSGTRIVEQMEKRGWDVGNVRLTVMSKVSKDMNRATEIAMEIEVEADLTEEQREEVLREAGRCFVGNTLRNPPEIKIELKVV